MVLDFSSYYIFNRYSNGYQTQQIMKNNLNNILEDSLNYKNR